MAQSFKNPFWSKVEFPVGNFLLRGLIVFMVLKVPYRELSGTLFLATQIAIRL
jgi:hypothetical protein